MGCIAAKCVLSTAGGHWAAWPVCKGTILIAALPRGAMLPAACGLLRGEQEQGLRGVLGWAPGPPGWPTGTPPHPRECLWQQTHTATHSCLRNVQGCLGASMQQFSMTGLSSVRQHTTTTTTADHSRARTMHPGVDCLSAWVPSPFFKISD